MHIDEWCVLLGDQSLKLTSADVSIATTFTLLIKTFGLLQQVPTNERVTGCKEGNFGFLGYNM
jgi:hypothetical protein